MMVARGDRMSWVDYTTLGISAGTFLIVVVNTIFNIRARRKDRRITVFLEERRKMHNELFNHIIQILDIGGKSMYVESFDKRQELRLELLNHKIYV